MSLRDEYLFWRLADQLILNHNYRLLKVGANEKELWLENVDNKKAQIIRILHHSIDWSNLMKRDIETTAFIGERFRKKYIRGALNMINIYVTPFPPVDEYEYLIKKPFFLSDKAKTIVTTVLMEPNRWSESFKQMGFFLGNHLNIPVSEQYDDHDIVAIKQATIAHSADKVKKEKAIFANGKPFFTYILVVIQIIVFLLLELNGGSNHTSTLIQFGAKVNPLILEGEWWRFFSPIFIHIGFFHLIMNSIALYFVGNLVERIFGNARFLIIYLFAGFSGALASFAFSPSISAGASGAIFGCFGALLYFGIRYPKLFFRTMGMNILLVIILDLAIGFTVPGIDNAGHLGGLIGGFLASGFLHFPHQKKLPMQLIYFSICTTIVVGFLLYGYSDMTKEMNTQSSYALIQSYVDNEEYNQAYTILKNVEAVGESSPDLYYMLAYVEMKKGMKIQAEQHLHQVIRIDSSFHQAYYFLALIYLDDFYFEKAQQNALKAADIKPNLKEYQDLVEKINTYMMQFSR